MPTFLEVTFVIFLMCVDNNGTFSFVLKHPNITPVFKMGYRGSKVQFFHHQCLLIMRDYISFEHLLMNLEKQFYYLQCYNINKEKHLDIPLFYTCVPTILMLSTVPEI